MSSVILINPFEIQEGEKDECLGFWEKAADYLKNQPGFTSNKLHRAIVPWARFTLINLAEWESVEHFEKAINNEDFKKLIAPYNETCPQYPGSYEVIRF